MGDADPLFPATLMVVGDGGGFAREGLKRAHWTTADPIRRVFRQAFEAAGLPYFQPHSFRRTIVMLGQSACRTPEQFKAWSQNLGHEDVLTTFTSYGAVSPHRQAELILALDGQAPAEPSERTEARLARLERAFAAQALGAA